MNCRGYQRVNPNLKIKFSSEESPTFGRIIPDGFKILLQAEKGRSSPLQGLGEGFEAIMERETAKLLVEYSSSNVRGRSTLLELMLITLSRLRKYRCPSDNTKSRK
jgi:hypothetical protein